MLPELSSDVVGDDEPLPPDSSEPLEDEPAEVSSVVNPVIGLTLVLPALVLPTPVLPSPPVDPIGALTQRPASPPPARSLYRRPEGHSGSAKLQYPFASQTPAAESTWHWSSDSQPKGSVWQPIPTIAATPRHATLRITASVYQPEPVAALLLCPGE